MAAIASILRLDARGVTRDGVLMINIGLSLVVVCALAMLGLNRDGLGLDPYFPVLIGVSLVSGPTGYGFLFGQLMVDENESGVRRALNIVPVGPRIFLAARSFLVTVLLIAWPLASVYLVNTTWQLLALSFPALLAVVLSLCLVGTFTAIALPCVAANKIEALALFKGITFVSLAPLAMWFLPSGAWWTWLFLLSPTGWGMHAYLAFLHGADLEGNLLAAGGVAFNLALTLVAGHIYLRRI
jgi:hypothetical protein